MAVDSGAVIASDAERLSEEEIEATLEDLEIFMDDPIALLGRAIWLLQNPGYAYPNLTAPSSPSNSS